MHDLGLDGRIIFKWILRKSICGGYDLIDLAYDRGKCGALVNAVVNIWVP